MSETTTNPRRRLIVVAGLSGSGKSQAMKSFEDLGYTCLDGIPPALLGDAVRLAERAGRGRLAVGLETRVGGAFGDPVATLTALDEGAVRPEILYLEADDATIVRRYSETRRRHPLADSGSLDEAIAREREALAPLRALATDRWETSSLTLGALKARIASRFGADDGRTALDVRIVAFGFKHGSPRDADLVFDVRFLANPNYVAELKPLDGRDAPVAEFLERLPETHELLTRLESLLDFLAPQYAREGKSRLTIGVGCTGGRHRSVYVASALAAHLARDPALFVSLDLRDLPGGDHA